jgi:DNA-binding FadR family transcriptional regulator
MPIEPGKADRLIADLSTQMDSGDLPPGAKLPSDSELRERYGVGQQTIRTAVERLRHRIVFVPGRGRFVRDTESTSPAN